MRWKHNINSSIYSYYMIMIIMLKVGCRCSLAELSDGVSLRAMDFSPNPFVNRLHSHIGVPLQQQLVFLPEK